MTDHPLNILKWLKDAGDDIALADAPINRFGESEKSAKKVDASKSASKAKTRANIAARAKAVAGNIAKKNNGSSSNSGNNSHGATLPDESAIAKAAELANSAKTIDELKEVLSTFDGCNLKRGAKNLVFSDGNKDSEIMFIGKAPERFEDINGTPFSGSAGALFDKMLESIGLDREQVYLAPIVPWITPGARPPTPAECEICRPFIERHIELASPKLIITMGNAATRTLRRETKEITRVRGSFKEIKIGAVEINSFATLNPSHLLRHPAQKALAWDDLLAIKAHLNA